MSPHASLPVATLSLFGGPTVDRGGEHVGLSPTQQALLALVWGHEQRGISRRRAIWLLWEEEDGARARQRLRQLLSDLRGRLGLGHNALNGDDILIGAPAVLRSDIDEYRAALRTGELGRALELERAGFAANLRRVPGQQFEDWLEAKRAGLRRTLRQAASAAWDASWPIGEWRRAREAAEVLHALEPVSDEATVRKVIEARVMTGNPESAEAAYAAFVDALPEGAVVEEETVDLLDRVRRLATQATFQERTPDEPPPLVGRQADLEAARGMLRRVRDGAFEFLLLKGEAGVGKTRLLEEIRRESHLKGFRCLRARPVELEQKIPLNPLVDALSDPDVGRHVRALEDPWRAVIASILPTLPAGMERPVVPPIAETGLSRRLYDAFSILFSRLASDEPTLLFIDDLQWADATTVAVLQFAQRRWQSGPLGVVATLRADLVSGTEGVAKYLADSRDLPVTSIELRDLGEAEAEELVDLVAQGAIGAPLRKRLCALGGRNPFYLIELTRDWLAGHLHMPELPSDAITIPISLRQLLDPRIACLSDGAASAASYLAVWGRWISISDLAGLTGTELRACAERVEELERYRLVSMERGKVRVAHELFRGALYHRMSEARRAWLHRTVAEYLTSSGPSTPGELAIHFSRAGEAVEAARFGRQAADAALENGAMAEAAHFLQVVTENVKDLGLKAEATADLAKVLHMNREIARANPLLELAATRLRETGNHARALRMDIRRVEGLAEVGATPMSDLLDRLASIKKAARDASDWEALALALDSELHLLHRSGKVSAIRELFREIRQCSELGDRAAACLANASLALTVLFGDGKEALDRAREAVRIAEAYSLERCMLMSLSRLVLVMTTLGRLFLDEARAPLDKARRLSETSGDLVLRFHVQANEGVAHMDAGDLDAAEGAFAKASALVSEAEADLLRFTNAYNLGELMLQRGDYPHARQFFEQAEVLTRASTPDFYRDLVSAGIGLCALEMGAISEARLREEQLDQSRQWYFDPTLILTFRARLLERRGRPQEALERLHASGQSLEHRFPTCWIRLQLAAAQMARRRNLRLNTEGIERACALASALCLTTRERQLRFLACRS